MKHVTEKHSKSGFGDPGEALGGPGEALGTVLVPNSKNMSKTLVRWTPPGGPKRDVKSVKIRHEGVPEGMIANKRVNFGCILGGPCWAPVFERREGRQREVFGRVALQ